MDMTDHPSLQSPKQVTQNFKSLRTHGLVSNSIFKQIDGNDSPSAPAPASPLHTKRWTVDGMPASPAPYGAGTAALGLSPYPKAIRVSQDAEGSRSSDENSTPFISHNASSSVDLKSSPQRKIPRKSLGRLHESHYVSNSVFRADAPTTPPPRVGSATSSPGSATKGLLTSNRLHGPRYMNPTTAPGSPFTSSPTHKSPSRKERRKTVTFDEILDVQEFEKEASFDTSSVRIDDDEDDDAGSIICNQEGTPPVAPLKVVNVPMDGEDLPKLASSGESETETELETSHDDESRETISDVPSPQGSPQARSSSFDRDFTFGRPAPVCTNNDVVDDDRDSSLLKLSAADRVDSLVDDLLSQDILNSPSLRPRLPSTDFSLPPISMFEPLASYEPSLPAEVNTTTPLYSDQTQPLVLPQVVALPTPATDSAIQLEPFVTRTPVALLTSATEHKAVAAPSPTKQTLDYERVKSPLESLGTELQKDYFDPNSLAPTSRHIRPRRKRSMSTSDAPSNFTNNADPDQSLPADLKANDVAEGIEVESRESRTSRKSIGADLAKSKELLDASLQRAIDGGFQHSLEKEFSRIYEKDELPYKVKDCGTFQGVDDKVTHSTTAGDVDSGKAWKKVRRPSDMNEYKKEMRELLLSDQVQARPAAGKVFVMVDSFTPTDLPVPTSRPTKFHCILDNGLHMVKTATVPLRPGRGTTSEIGQEFELIQHRNLEFSLTLVVQRDAHLMEPVAPPSPTRREHDSPSLKGFGRFFSSPKKQAYKRDQLDRAAAVELASQVSRVEPMLAYLNQEGAFGRTGVAFERVAKDCTAKCLVLDLPVNGASNPAMNGVGPSSMASKSHTSVMASHFRANLSKVRGTLRLKMFYLPPLPTVPRDRMPENLADCIKGMQDAAWHRAEPWLSGTLTQLGGDCASWRRRPIKAQGQYLICFSTVTKKPTVKIDLSKAICVEELGNHVTTGSMIFPASRASQMTMTKSRTMASSTTLLFDEDEDADANYHIDRSFRITFADGERIQYFADTEEEKAKWVQVVTDLIDNGVPENLLWAQTLLETGQGAAPILERAPGSFQTQRFTTTVAEEDETPAVVQRPAPATPQKDVFVRQHLRTQSAGVHLETTPQRQASNKPSRVPVPVSAPRATASEIVMSTRTSSTMLASPKKKMAPADVRVTVHDPSNRAAFDRLKRAGGQHHRSRTEDYSASPRRF